MSVLSKFKKGEKKESFRLDFYRFIENVHKSVEITFCQPDKYRFKKPFLMTVMSWSVMRRKKEFY